MVQYEVAMTITYVCTKVRCVLLDEDCYGKRSRACYKCWAQTSSDRHTLFTVGRNVDEMLHGVMPHCQTKVCDAAGHVGLDQDVTALEVSVGDGRLLCLIGPQVRVEEGQPTGNGAGKPDHLLRCEDVNGEVVKEGAMGMVLTDHPQFHI